MKPWRIESPTGEVQADSREAAVRVVQAMIRTRIIADDVAAAKAIEESRLANEAAEAAGVVAAKARNVAALAASIAARSPGNAALQRKKEIAADKSDKASKAESDALALAAAKRITPRPPVEHTIYVVDPDGQKFAVTAPVRGGGRLAFAPVKEKPKPLTSFAVYWRTREYLPHGEGDPRLRRVAAGAWHFRSRWGTRDEAVEAAIQAENEGIGPSVGPDSPRRDEGAIEAEIREEAGGAKRGDPAPVVNRWRRAPGEMSFTSDGSIQAYRREGDATFGGRGVPQGVTTHRRRK